MSEFHEPQPSSPIVPVQLGLDDTFRFRCHRAIACFNKCCENIDILLTPYDIVRLKKRLGLTSREFIERHTVECTLDAHGMPGLKLKTREASTACQFLGSEGCSVYADRPAACRYYALGLMAMRKKDSPVEEDSYFVVKESHCLGHFEPNVQTVREYRIEQGVDVYDEINREWKSLILKKRSSGPALGRPSQRSFELFFLASYDVDGFREFVQSPSFQEVFDIPTQELRQIAADDVKLLQFGFRLLKQVLFGERTIAIKPAAVEKRRERYQLKLKEQAERKAQQLAEEQDQIYDSLD